MKTLKTVLKKGLCLVLSLGITIQPVVAATYQYNVFVKGFKPPGGGVGAGDVIVNPGSDAQTGVQSPVLVLEQPALIFGESTPASSSTGSSSTTGLKSVGLKRLGVDSTSTSTPPNQTDLNSVKTTVLRNQGAVPAVIAGIDSTTSFDVQNDCGFEIKPGSSCSITASYVGTPNPNQTYVTEILTIRTVGGDPVALALRAKLPHVPTASLRFIPDALPFTLVPKGVSMTMSSTLKNTGDAAATVAGIGSNDTFQVTNDCPTTLQPGESCQVSATAVGLEAGAKSQSYSISVPFGSNAATLGLNLTAEQLVIPAPKLSVTPNILSFGMLAPPGSPLTTTAVIHNSGSADAQLGTLSLNTSDFQVTSECGATLAVNDSCTLTVVSGTAPGVHNAQLNIGAPDAKGSTLLSLSSQFAVDKPDSAKLSFAPGSVPFGGVLANASQSATAVLTNVGVAPATLESAGFEPDSSLVAQTNDCPSTLEPGASCNFALSFSPKGKVDFSTSLVVHTAEKVDTRLSVTGTGLQAILGVSPTVDFGLTSAKGGASVSRSVSFVNSGNMAVTGLAVNSISGPFTITGTTCTDTLDPQKGCAVTVQFAPTASGVQTGSMTVSSSNSGSPTVTLTGAGTMGELTTDPGIVAFPEIAVGTLSSVQRVTVTNNGQDPVGITGISVTNGVYDFGQSNNCGSTLAPGGSCAVNVSFRPFQEGVRTGGLAIQANGLSPISVALNGSAFTQKLEFTPGGIGFGQVAVGSTAPVQTAVLHNPSTHVATLSGLGLLQGNQGFTQSNNCGTELPAGASCQLSVQFTAPSQNSFGDQVVANSSFGDFSLKMTAEGIIPKVKFEGGGGGGGTGPDTGGGTGTGSGSGYNVVFNDTAVGQTSLPRSVTFTNVGTAGLGITGISVANGIAEFAQSNNCGSTLAAGASCTIALNFTPAVLGLRTGSLAVITSEGQFMFTLSGYGAKATGVWQPLTSSSFGVTKPGTPVNRSFKFTNTSVSSVPVYADLAGPEVALVANTCGTPDAPVKLASQQFCGVTVQYAPQTAPSELTDVALRANSTQLPAPITQKLRGQSSQYGMAFSTAAFGKVAAGTTTARWIYLVNTSLFTDSLAADVGVTGTGFTILTNNCLKGLNIPANSSCGVYVQVNAPAIDGVGTVDLQGSLSGSSTHGVSAEGSLTATSFQEAYSMSWADSAAKTKDVNFGDLLAPTTSVHGIRLTNTSIYTMTLAGAPVLSGDPAFTVYRNDCGSSATLSPGASCTLYVQANVAATGNPGTYLLSGSVSVSNTKNVTATFPIAVNAIQDTNSMGFTDQNTVTPGFGDYGTVIAPSSTLHSIKLVNTSKTNQKLAGAVQLSGDGYSWYRNDCGAGLILTPGAACMAYVYANAKANTAPGSYTLDGALTVTNTMGVTASLTLVTQYTQEEYSMAFVDQNTATAGSGDYGTVVAPSSTLHSIKLVNTSKSSQKLASAVQLTGDSYSWYRNDCGAGLVLAPGAACTAYVYANAAANTAPGDYVLEGSLNVTNTMGVTATLPLVAKYTQEAYSMSFADQNTATSGMGDYGKVTAPSSTLHSIKLINTSKSSQKLASAVQLSGSGYSWYRNDCGAGLVLVPGASCYAYVYANAKANTAPGDYVLEGSLTATNTMGVTTTLSLVTRYSQEEYSMAFNDTTTPGSPGNFGTLKVPSSTLHGIRLVNTSKSSETLSGAVLLDGAGFTWYRNDCSAGLVLSPGAGCYAYVYANAKAGTPPGTYGISGSLSVTNTMGVATAIPLSATVVQP